MSAFSVFTAADRKRSFALTKSRHHLECESSLDVLGNDQTGEIEKKKTKMVSVFPTRQILLDYLTKPDWKTFSHQRVITSKEPYQEESLKESKINHWEDDFLDAKLFGVPKTNNFFVSSSQTGILKNKPDLARISKVMRPNDKEPPFFSPVKSLLALSNISSSYIKEDYVNQVRHIISSWQTNENELKNLNPMSKAISLIHQTPLRRSYPQFESVRTPVQECQSSTPPELLDCCQSNARQPSTSTVDNREYWDSFRTSVLLREKMIDISKRLSKMYSLPMVDTHCHFDLIFDRLYIKHNSVTKYFDDYKDLYPSGLSFELAVHVFWRPRHLNAENWHNWYSKYLDDDRVYGSCGIHPHWSSAWRETSSQDIERCLQHPKVVAIGEIGLDFGPKNTCNVKQQCRVFEEQLKLAAKWFKPVVIHSRNAYQQTFELMKQHLQSNHKIHLHCFVGSIDDVHLFTSYFTNIKFGFTPLISHGNSLHPVIEQLHLEQMLSETDSPYFVPEELASVSRCAHPSMVYSVIEIIARIRRVSLTEVACQLRKNAYEMYGV